VLGTSVTVLGTATVDARGTATFSTFSLPAGDHAITAVYGGDPNFDASTSPALNEVINQDATTTTLSVSGNPAIAGQPLTLTATVVAAAPRFGPPTGSVLFLDGRQGHADSQQQHRIGQPRRPHRRLRRRHLQRRHGDGQRLHPFQQRHRLGRRRHLQRRRGGGADGQRQRLQRQHPGQHRRPLHRRGRQQLQLTPRPATWVDIPFRPAGPENKRP
jgi:hypothetical protein